MLAENTSAYYVDDGLIHKFNSVFMMPEKDEIDVVLN